MALSEGLGTASVVVLPGASVVVVVSEVEGDTPVVAVLEVEVEVEVDAPVVVVLEAGSDEVVVVLGWSPPEPVVSADA